MVYKVVFWRSALELILETSGTDRKSSQAMDNSCYKCGVSSIGPWLLSQWETRATYQVGQGSSGDGVAMAFLQPVMLPARSYQPQHPARRRSSAACSAPHQSLTPNKLHLSSTLARRWDQVILLLSAAILFPVLPANKRQEGACYIKFVWCWYWPVQQQSSVGVIAVTGRQAR